MPRANPIRIIAFVWLNLLLLKCSWAQVPLPQKITMFGTSVSLSQDVAVSVQEINAITVSGNVTLNISGAMAGSSPTGASDATTSYNVTVNGGSKKLTGALDAQFSSGISLEVLLSPPTGGTAVLRKLGTTTRDLVTGFGYVAETGLAITYTAIATVQAAPNGAGQTRTVIFTLTNL
jgi:hypothetical protein